MISTFVTTILYTQLVVARPDLPQVAMLWTDDEVAQGFAWDESAVAFGIPDHDGTCLVEIDTAPDAPFAVAPDALWAVAVPFDATSPIMDIGTVMLEKPFAIVPGRYRLVFEARPGGPEHTYRLDLTFVPDPKPGYAILKQGELGTDKVLRTQVQKP